jgi:hypothetical protein
MEQPSLDLKTQGGTLRLTFIDPDRNKSDRNTTAGHVLIVTGDVKINGIPIRVSTRLWYQWYESADQQGGSYKLSEDWTHSYNRRIDVAPGSLGQITDNARRQLTALFSGAVREAYESRPDLQLEAQRWELWNDHQQACRAISAAQVELRLANEKHDMASVALLAFNQAHPAPTPGANATPAQTDLLTQEA